MHHLQSTWGCSQFERLTGASDSPAISFVSGDGIYENRDSGKDDVFSWIHLINVSEIINFSWWFINRHGVYYIHCRITLYESNKTPPPHQRFLLSHKFWKSKTDKHHNLDVFFSSGWPPFGLPSSAIALNYS